MTTATASAASRPAPDLRAPALDWRRLASLAAWTALTLFVLLAALLAARRIAGALTQPLPGPILVPLAAGIAAACVLLRLWLFPLRLDSLRQRSVIWWLLAAGPSLAVAATVAALITPGTSPPAAVAALLLAGAIEGLFWRHLAVMLRAPAAESVGRVPRLATPGLDAIAGRDEIGDEAYPKDLLQQIVRTRGQAGGELLHAALRAEFQPGEQVQVLHVAFCPPLASVPELEAYAAGEIEAAVKVTSAYSFGARLEVHLPAPMSEPLSVMVELTGIVGQASSLS